jgi:hypothetical protein
MMEDGDGRMVENRGHHTMRRGMPPLRLLGEISYASLVESLSESGDFTGKANIKLQQYLTSAQS